MARDMTDLLFLASLTAFFVLYLILGDWDRLI